MGEQQSAHAGGMDGPLSVLAETNTLEQGVRTGTLVAVSPDGAPLPQRVWCADVNGTLYLAVQPGSPASRHLADDGRVCLLLGGGETEEETITGHAEPVGLKEDGDPVLARLAGSASIPRRLFRVTPAPLAPPEAVEDPSDRRLLVQHMFSDLPRTVARAMAHRLRYQAFEAGDVVIRQGSKGDQFFIVVDGEVDVVEEHPGGAEHFLTTLGPGESFGEAALLLNTPRTATVRARTPLRVLALDKHTFEQVVLLSSESDAE
jgi:hypothetical protein